MPGILAENEGQTDTPKIIQPRNHKARICLWQDLAVNHIDELNEANTPAKIKEILIRIFDLNSSEDNLKNGILLDLYYFTIQFAKDNKFNGEQTSAFFSMVKKTHEICIETPFGNLQQCFEHFKDLVLCHAVKRPPYCIDLFNPDEVKKITEYVLNTYFRHFKMYKYAFTPMVRLDLSISYTGMPQTPPASEAGDEEQNVDAETEAENAEDANKGDGDAPAEPTEEHDDEPQAAKELRAMIKSHLEDEIKKLRVSMEEQLKQSEDNLNQKLGASEGKTSPTGKRASSRGKKK